MKDGSGKMQDAALKALEIINEYEEGICSQDKVAIELADYIKKYGSPIIYERKVAFVYLGFARKVCVAGDWNGWNPHVDTMQRIGITPVFYLVKEFPLDARLEYKFIVNGKRILDPYNPLVVKDKFGPNSELRMPEYKLPEFLSYAPILSGKIHDLSVHFNRIVKVYTPPGYEYAERKYPLIIVNDGSDYLKYAKINRALDFLISTGKIEPLIAALVDPLDRIREYSLNGDYADFLVYDVLRFVKSRYNIVEDENKYCILGASLGGLYALYTALLYPTIFGCCISQSGAFLKVGELSSFGIVFEHDIFDIVKEYDGRPLKVVLEWGAYERVAEVDFAERNKKVFKLLKAKNFAVYHYSINQGHNWFNWRDSLPQALEVIFGI